MKAAEQKWIKITGRHSQNIENIERNDDVLTFQQSSDQVCKQSDTEAQLMLWFH